MEEIIRKIIEEKMKGEVLKKAKCIGEVPVHLSNKIKNIKFEDEHLHEELELKKNQYELEIKKKLFEYFNPKFEQLEKKHKEVWNKVYDLFNLDPDGNYYYKDGKIYIYSNDEQPDHHEWKMSEIDFKKPHRI